MEKIFLLLMVTSTLAKNLGHAPLLTTLFRWKQIDFEYPSTEARQQAIDDREFIQAEVFPYEVERWKDRVFISTPRLKSGIPATLSSVQIGAPTDSPLLQPYPDWKWQDEVNCTGFVSIYCMSIDDCGVMWVLDSGLRESRQVCPPTLYAINLDSDTVVGRYPIPNEQLLQNSRIINLVVDSRDAQCRDLHVYMSDPWEFGLIVFRHEDAAFWRFTHYSFYTAGSFLKRPYDMEFDFLSIKLIMHLGKYRHGDRPLYYQSRSSSNKFVVKSSVIRDPKRVNNSAGEFRLLGRREDIAAAATERNDVIFFISDVIVCWNQNTSKPYNIQNIIESRLNLTNILLRDFELDHEIPPTGWMISANAFKYYFMLMKPNEYNYRVLYFDPEVAIKNACPSENLNSTFIRENF
ncbi:protein yellow-like [Helicoverpa zea]|uniref:protein yellow-like n=1 Tax=Helicoverpa zea TaxID=7113 RepID=UPI001F5827D1|nr:protein yellow-like [Helicoverpa zea]